MNGWLILGLVVLALFLIGQVRVGVAADYTGEGLTVRARLGAVRVKVFPLPKREKKEKKPKKKKPPKEKKHKEGKAKAKGGALILVQEFVPLALEAAGCFWRRLVVDELELLLIVGSTDPADAAMLYGQANAALGAMWEPLTRAFHVKKGRAGVRVDFEAQGTTVRTKASLSLKIGQILWLGIHFGIKALMRLIRYKKQMELKQQERKAV